MRDVETKTPGRWPARLLCRLAGGHPWAATWSATVLTLQCGRCGEVATAELPAPASRQHAREVAPWSLLGSETTGRAAVDAVAGLLAHDRDGLDAARQLMWHSPQGAIDSLILLALIMARSAGADDARALKRLHDTALEHELGLLDATS